MAVNIQLEESAYGCCQNRRRSKHVYALRDVSKICALQFSRSFTSHTRWPELLITLKWRLLINQLVLDFQAFFRIFDGTFRGGSPTGGPRSSFSDDEESRLLYLSIPIDVSCVFIDSESLAICDVASIVGMPYESGMNVRVSFVAHLLPKAYRTTIAILLASSRHHVLKMELPFY